MKPLYKCEVCDRTHEKSEDAIKCENGHTIIKPKLFWLIPLVGFFMIPYSVFAYKNSIVIFDKSIKHDLMRCWITINPILIIMLWLFYYMYIGLHK